MPAFVQELLTKLGAVAPTAIKLIIIALIGFIGTRLVSRALARVLDKLPLEASLERLGFASMWRSAFKERTPAQLIATIVRYLGYLLTLMAIAQIAQIEAVSIMIAKLLAMLPKLGTTALIGLAGVWLAGFVRDLLEGIVSKRRELESPKLIAQGGYYLVVMLTVSTCASQLDLKVELIQMLMLLTVGATIMAGALATILGAYPFIEQLISRYYVIRTFERGQTIQLNGLEGIIVQFAPINAIIKTPQGRLAIPYHQLLKGTIKRTA